MKLRNITILLTFLSTLTASNIVAAEISAMIDGITVHAERLWPEEPVILLDRHHLPANGDLATALSQQEGLSIIRRAATAGDPLLRGLQRDNINVLIDGQPLFGACPSHMDPTSAHVDAAAIETTTILKGPYDATRPGGLGGTIDLQRGTTPVGLRGRASVSYGSFASRAIDTGLSYDNGSMSAAAGYAHRDAGVPQDGHGRPITALYSPTQTQRYLNPIAEHAYDNDSLWVSLGTASAAGTETRLDYAYQDADTTLYPYLKMDAVYDRTRRLSGTTTWQRPVDGVDLLTLRAYWNDVHHLMNDRLRASSLPSMMVTRPYSMQSDASTATYGATLGAVRHASPTNWQYGLDFYRRTWDIVNLRAGYTTLQPYTPLAMIPDVASANLGAYLAFERAFTPAVRLKGGGRIDRTQVDAQHSNTVSAGDDRLSFNALSANLQGSWRVTPELELSAGLARGNRPPDGQELYIFLPAAPPAATWRGNPGLDATVNHQADLALSYASATSRFTLAGFYSRLYDYIQLASPNATTKSYANLAARRQGGEASAEINLPQRFTAGVAVSYVRGDNLSARRPLAETPPLSGRLTLRHQRQNWSCEVRENFADRQRRVDPALNEAPSAGWATTDFSADYRQGGLTITAGVDNLFDRYYATHLSYLRDPFASSTGTRVAETGRFTFVRLAYNF